MSFCDDYNCKVERPDGAVCGVTAKPVLSDPEPKWGCTSYRRLALGGRTDGIELYRMCFMRDCPCSILGGYETAKIEVWAKSPTKAYRHIVASRKNPTTFHGKEI